MRKIIILSLLTGLFAGELEVEGNLTVTEGVNASSFAGDGSGLTNLPSLGDMKPERIYQFIPTSEGWSSTITVPSSKMWIIIPSSANNAPIPIILNGVNRGNILDDNGAKLEFIAFSGQSFSIYQYDLGVVIAIYEYSISGSGTDQGMDYVEP